MSSVVNAIFGDDDNSDVQAAAERQAAETRKAAESQAQAARFQAQAAQIQQEGLAARQRAEQTAAELMASAKPVEAAEVVVGKAPALTDDGKRKRLTPRSAFNRPKADASSITI